MHSAKSNERNNNNTKKRTFKAAKNTKKEYFNMTRTLTVRNKRLLLLLHTNMTANQSATAAHMQFSSTDQWSKVNQSKCIAVSCNSYYNSTRYRHKHDGAFRISIYSIVLIDFFFWFLSLVFHLLSFIFEIFSCEDNYN